MADRDESAVPGQHYFAFLSYSHADEGVAKWLHEEIEKFRVPSRFVGRLTAHGPVPRRLHPIFRDMGELPASDDLGSEIREAIAHSRFLIVLCSPAAAMSHWTNAEIETFKRVHSENRILAAVVSGEPFGSDIEGREQEECFPPALRYHYDKRGRRTDRRAEPLAADLRGDPDSRRIGFLKLVAGMLGLGLDELVQREALRRQRRLAGITAGSLIGMLAASGLAVTAIQARDAARDQRREAEGLVAFMLGDLKEKLEPLGRLDVLDSVGARALAYYGQQEPSELSDDALAQRSRALTLLGQVASDKGDLSAATGFFHAALNGTAEALRRSPDDPQRNFDHAQNVFYVGEVARQRGQLKQAEAAMREYKRLALRLIASDPTNPTWQMEGIYADTNLGVMLNDQGRFAEAAAVFENALVERERLATAEPSNPQYRKALVEGLGWLMTARERQGRFEDALAAGERQARLLQPLIADPRADTEYRRMATVAYRDLGRITAARGDHAKGIAYAETAVALSDRLSSADPTNSYWLARGGWARLELGRMHLAARAVNKATSLIRDGCDIADRLNVKDPNVIEWRVSMRSECLELQARAALARGETAGARDHAARMVAITRAEATERRSARAQLALANAYLVRGLVEASAGNPQGAAAAFGKGVQVWPASAPQPPIQIARRVILLKGSGRGSEAEALTSRLETFGYRELLYLRDRAAVG